MKIIFLNTWGGRVEQPLLEFFKNNQDVDVFCLQEVWSNALQEKMDNQKEIPNLFQELGSVLNSHEGFFAPADKDGDYGLALFFKKSLALSSKGNIMIHDKEDYYPDIGVTTPPRNLQYVHLEKDNKKISIINFHGLWTGQGKDDTEDRLKQSENIITFLKTLENPFVLGGDFNLNPNTQSLSLLEDFGLKNLIREYRITSTRTSFYAYENKFADYVLTSPDIKVQDFKVLPEEVSDHSPLCVTIDL